MGAISEYAELKHKEELLGNAIEWLVECFQDCEYIVRSLDSWGFDKGEIREVFKWADDYKLNQVNEIIEEVFNEY